jgi:hypothetical protein
VTAFQYSGSTPKEGITAPLVLVNALGCVLSDYTAVSGKVALISRGNCTFVEKADFAFKSGAIAAVIYNNVGT